jgi:Domain of unknown function (DUF4136)
MNRIMVLLALAFAVSPLTAHRVRIDFDHRGNFSQYKTYRWVQPAVSRPPQELFPNQLMRERIVGFIEEALAARHLTRVQTGGDMLVSYNVNVSEQQQFTTFTNGFGPGWGWGWDGGTAISTTVPQVILTGTLVVNLTDAHKQQLLFQGVSSQTLSSRPARNTKRLAKAVNEIFEKYPPR